MNLTFIEVLPNHLWLFYRCFTSSKLLSGVPEVCVRSLSRYGSERQRRGGRVCVGEYEVYRNVKRRKWSSIVCDQFKLMSVNK